MKKILSIIALVCLLTTTGLSQLEEKLNKFGQDFSKGYVKPLVTAFGADLNSGLYHNSKLKTGIDIYFGIKFMVAFIPSSSQEFNADLSELNAARDPLPSYGTPVKTATFFGNKGAVATSTLDTLQLPDGVNLKYAPVAVPHISIGNIFGTRAIIRFAPSYKIKDMGEFSFIGIGVQHDIGQWLPTPLPFDWSAHIMYQSMKVKPVVEANAFSFGTEVSKTFAIATVYGGFAYESSSMKFKYNIDPTSDLYQTIQRVEFDLTGENTVRLTAGLALKLLIFNINADYSIAKQPVASLGIGFAI
jgi:hypothetical protein